MGGWRGCQSHLSVSLEDVVLDLELVAWVDEKEGDRTTDELLRQARPLLDAGGARMGPIGSTSICARQRRSHARVIIGNGDETESNYGSVLPNESFVPVFRTSPLRILENSTMLSTL